MNTIFVNSSPHDQKKVLGIMHENWLRIDRKISEIIRHG